MLFAELPYTLATEEAERIGVDHVARMTSTGTGENSTGNTEGFNDIVYCVLLFNTRLLLHLCIKQYCLIIDCTTK